MGPPIVSFKDKEFLKKVKYFLGHIEKITSFFERRSLRAGLDKSPISRTELVASNLNTAGSAFSIRNPGNQERAMA
jgi:hypothetical protein